MKIKSIWIENEAHSPQGWDPADSNSLVVVTLEDGSQWSAMSFSYKNIASLVEKNRRTGEWLSGKYFWAADMVLVEEVSRDCIEKVITQLVDINPQEFKEIFLGN